MWNTQEHLEAYFAVPMQGAVLHTLNIRLFPEQLAYIVNHAGDRVILVDDVLVPLLARVAAELETVERYVVVGDGDVSVARRRGARLHRVRPLRRRARRRRSRGVRLPRGRRVGRRGDVLHERHHRQPEGRRLLAPFHVHAHHRASRPDRGIPYTWNDRLLPIVPMFHANAWGAPYAAWMAGADLLMPGRYLQAEPLAKFIASERPTTTCAVPTIWADLLRYSEDHDVDFSSLQRIMCGGAAVPRALMEAFQERFGIRMLQAWGMTETSPRRRGVPPAARRRRSARRKRWTGGRSPGGRSPGWSCGSSTTTAPCCRGTAKRWARSRCRGSWITGSYYGDPAPEKFDDGWLRTGDIASVTPERLREDLRPLEGRHQVGR